ncbi:unnamed protein product, partial [Larinioides sclopetarius]
MKISWCLLFTYPASLIAQKQKEFGIQKCCLPKSRNRAADNFIINQHIAY